jgi:hypothetical protein
MSASQKTFVSHPLKESPKQREWFRNYTSKAVFHVLLEVSMRNIALTTCLFSLTIALAHFCSCSNHQIESQGTTVNDDPEKGREFAMASAGHKQNTLPETTMHDMRRSKDHPFF